MVDPGSKPHIGGPVISTSQNFVCVEGIPIATVSDTCLCSGAPTTSDRIKEGSSIARINGKRIARMGDSCSHGGRLAQGVSWITFE
ncbi:PAAR domain-containing protein [Neorhizobium huautlense]|uniref:PAAR domain-containing protein n=1 Tax=Neorhizobium huautlense TaxID=67774 RepID=UPI00315A862C